MKLLAATALALLATTASAVTDRYATFVGGVTINTYISPENIEVTWNGEVIPGVLFQEWVDFMLDSGKEYSDSEEYFRFKVFRDNKDYIDKHNQRAHK